MGRETGDTDPGVDLTLAAAVVGALAGDAQHLCRTRKPDVLRGGEEARGAVFGSAVAVS
ncbi:hypothetical protein [Actinocrispum wychmicini]|uniref:hypothetical protein n=1 Tax=Actinocrispum wychmicini TaxID=1213861 RepID=UPI001FB69B03|nr:hypothetical protein [Actinocrispum wychmicini]